MPTGSYTYNLRFPGQYYDAESGFHYNVNRDYEPATGRYVQSDPIGLGGGISTYSYVNSGPLNNFDVFGLACNARGCWNTAQEKALYDIEDYAGYYATACAGHDPYACRAGEVSTNTGDGLRGALSGLTNFKLAMTIIGKQPPECPAEIRQGVTSQMMQQIRVGLMKARVEQLTGAGPTSPRQVDRKSIADFHHKIFEQNGADANAFGGDAWDKSHLSGVTGYDWCEAPACKN